MRNLIEESKEQSSTMFRDGVPMFKTVTVRFEREGITYMYEISRSKFKGGNHAIDCHCTEATVTRLSVLFEESDCKWGLLSNEKRMSKRYSDNAKFEAAIKRIQSKMS
jgi:hypothetical protein